MSYIYLGDLRNTHLGQASGSSGSPEQLEKAASGLEATAKGLRATAVGPAAAALNSQAQNLETQAASLRRAAAQKRGESAPSNPGTTAPAATGTSWLVIGAFVTGALGLVGGGLALAASKKRPAMAMNPRKKSKRSKR